MSTFYIDTAERRKLATLWVKITLLSLHVWASALVISVLATENKNAAVIGDMFSTVTFGIGATLLILLIDRAADAVLSRFAAPVQPVTETVTRTVSTDDTTNAKDVNIQASGQVNVNN